MRPPRRLPGRRACASVRGWFSDFEQFGRNSAGFNVILPGAKLVQPNVNAEIRYRCPCCGYRTLQTPDSLALCPVCWWEDDGQEDLDAEEVRMTVNGDLSLEEARRFFANCGAAHPRFLPYVRQPEVTEQ